MVELIEIYAILVYMLCFINIYIRYIYGIVLRIVFIILFIHERITQILYTVYKLKLFHVG